MKAQARYEPRESDKTINFLAQESIRLLVFKAFLCQDGRRVHPWNPHDGKKKAYRSIVSVSTLQELFFDVVSQSEHEQERFPILCSCELCSGLGQGFTLERDTAWKEYDFFTFKRFVNQWFLFHHGWDGNKEMEQESYHMTCGYDVTTAAPESVILSSTFGAAVNLFSPVIKTQPCKKET